MRLSPVPHLFVAGDGKETTLPTPPLTLTEFVHPFTCDGLYELVEELCGGRFYDSESGCRVAAGEAT